MFNIRNTSTIYVSPTHGSYRASGLAPMPDGYGNGPYPTIDAALFYIGEMRKNGVDRPLRLVITEDIYLPEPVQLTNDHKRLTVESLGARKRIIGGVKIEHTLGLLGHSDADVLLHAVSDALLGAAGLGDIGKHFPDTDPQYKGADSLELLRIVAQRVREAGYRVSNIDVTMIAQAPKLKPHIEAMQQNIAAAVGIDVGRVNVKATTEEHLGFTGRKEGLSCHAVCLLEE